jgi:hypothetical protein
MAPPAGCRQTYEMAHTLLDGVTNEWHQPPAPGVNTPPTAGCKDATEETNMHEVSNYCPFGCPARALGQAPAPEWRRQQAADKQAGMR